LQFKR